MKISLMEDNLSHSLFHSTYNLKRLIHSNSELQGKFGNQNVICALRELLEDEDRNIRALVTMFLSRTLPAEDHETLAALIKKLDDTEELVREAGCAAMRHLRVRAALEKLNSIR